jgi:hypothetical protein
MIPSKRYLKPDDLSTDEAWDEADKAARQEWEDWRAMDAKALMAIRNNILGRPAEAIQGKTTVLDAWNALQITYEGKGGMLIYHAISDIQRLHCESAAKTDDYVNTFRKLLSQLSDLKAPLPDMYAIIFFVTGAKKAYPT